MTTDPPLRQPPATDGVTVFVVSWGRPIYLWSCLDALHRLTRSAARIILLDNAHPDPLMDRVITAFERRGLFTEVVRFPTNSFQNIRAAYRDRLEGIGSLHVYLEGDCVVDAGAACWLASMRGIMEAHPEIGVLGSLIDPLDFVPESTAERLVGGDAAAAEFLAKLRSPERAFRDDSSWSSVHRQFFLTRPPCPIPNPPGRLMMLRTDVMRRIGFLVDGQLTPMLQSLGLEAAVTPLVRHRHLSLLNIYDYADYDANQRNAFFWGHEGGS
jgi:GT2 family glycosyltransferase